MRRCTLCGMHGHVSDDHGVLTAPGHGVPIANVERALLAALGVKQLNRPAEPKACGFCSHVHTEPDICRAVAIDGGPCVCTKEAGHA